jgi:muramoyltetrapeptide carboxypeptidase LdcA involved in peptidoglycan recycling
VASWIDEEGAILFLETSEEAPSPATVDAYLTDLMQVGVFDAAAALVIGRPYGYTRDETEVLSDVVARRRRRACRCSRTSRPVTPTRC